jgi:hypothetical protein
MHRDRHHAGGAFGIGVDLFELVDGALVEFRRLVMLNQHHGDVVAHRTKYFRRIFETICNKPGVLFWNGEQILDWYLNAGPAAVPNPEPAG